MATVPPDFSPVEYLWPQVDLAVFSLTVWREARGEGPDGMTAVACTIRNRIGRPYFRKMGGNGYYDACTAPWQFSAMTARGDAQLGAWPKRNDVQFQQALWICAEVMAGRIKHPFPGADSYHDDSCSEEQAARAGHTPDRFVGRRGRLSFYDVDREA